MTPEAYTMDWAIMQSFCGIKTQRLKARHHHGRLLYWSYFSCRECGSGAEEFNLLPGNFQQETILLFTTPIKETENPWKLARLSPRRFNQFRQQYLLYNWTWQGVKLAKMSGNAEPRNTAYHTEVPLLSSLTNLPHLISSILFNNEHFSVEEGAEDILFQGRFRWR